MGKIKFLRGLKSKYNPELFKDYIYFAVDTKEIVVNGVSYGSTYDQEHLNSIISVSKGQSNSELVFTHRDGSLSIFTIPLASHTEDGLMSKEDKIILDDLYDRSMWLDLDMLSKQIQ